jgi:RNA polymerase sigma-70 factor (ECF subfamily)
MTDTFETYRPLLFSIAYRMLGSAMEAEDMVQETYLRYRAVPTDSVQSLKPFLTTIITRLCLDQLKSARIQREAYVGQWLPEPVLTGGDETYMTTTPEAQLSKYESISMAFLLLLESLSPLERAVFLLREVFDYDYDEIASIVEREEAACRQLYSRARKHVNEHRPRFQPSPETHRRILNQFIEAVENGKVDGLVNLLAEDVVWIGDGGGKIAAAPRPIHGRTMVMRIIAGLVRLAPKNAAFEITEVNGDYALITRVDGKAVLVITLESDGQRVTTFRVVVNPDKLARL